MQARKEERDHREWLLEATQDPCLPTIPKLRSEKDWPEFIQVFEAYLADPKYSPDGNGLLAETAKNAKTSDHLDTALVKKLQGDALTMFQNTGTKYLKRGFAKLAALKDNFAAESDLALA